MLVTLQSSVFSEIYFCFIRTTVDFGSKVEKIFKIVVWNAQKCTSQAKTIGFFVGRKTRCDCLSAENFRSKIFTPQIFFDACFHVSISLKIIRY
jgi:hypothetical protein